jgi:uncharacterized peroxidase-related enzyme
VKDESLVAALITDYKAAPISDTTRAMLTYVDKLTRTPGDVTATDVSALRRAGFSDAAILDICQVAAYYAYVNRIADGLGVEVEKES